MLICAAASLASAGRTDTGTFCSLDREIAGLMDAWTLSMNGSGGDFTTGTAMIRAEAALNAALQAEPDNMPEEAGKAWVSYLKASADCLFSFRLAAGGEDGTESEENLLASFTRWTTAGEEFLNAVQSTR